MQRALAGVPLLVVVLWSGSARAQDLAADVDKIVQLNKKALEHVDNLQWEDAKKTLLDALVSGKKAGLDRHPVLARTYVHLGCVYITGFNNRPKAMQSFRRALEIDPGIKVAKTMATAEVIDAFEEAGGQGRADSLVCPITETTRVDEAVPVRCAATPGLPVTKVFLLYREPAKKRFTAVEMEPTPQGWFRGRIPERVVYGESLQFYFEGRNAAGETIVKNGDVQRPNTVAIVKR